MKRIHKCARATDPINRGQLNLIAGPRLASETNYPRWIPERRPSQPIFFQRAAHGRDDDNDLSSLSTTPLHTI